MSLIPNLYKRHVGGGLAIAAVLLLATATSSSASTLVFQDVVMSGLANPRGMVVGPDGGLYVAEAGNGSGGDANSPSIISGDGSKVYLGASSGISSWVNGVQARVISALPSLAGLNGFGATGVHDVAFSPNGILNAIIGFGANPNARDSLPSTAALMGQIVTVSGGIATAFADLAEYERTVDPVAPELNSNPFSLVALPGGGFAASDSGGNDILSIDAAGVIGTLATLLPVANPLSPTVGGPTYQAVPTGIALGPDSEILIGQLTGFPFIVGAANVFSLDGTDLSTFATGFTNLIDVAYGQNGMVYALEHDSDSLLGPLTTGSLFGIAADGSKTLLYGGMESPTGLALGADGRVYVAVNGLSPSGGSVIALAPVPLPASLPIMAVLLVGIFGISRMRGRRI